VKSAAEDFFEVGHGMPAPGIVPAIGGINEKKSIYHSWNMAR
jgi:hypothetical protein